MLRGLRVTYDTRAGTSGRDGAYAMEGIYDGVGEGYPDMIPLAPHYSDIRTAIALPAGNSIAAGLGIGHKI